MVCYVETILPLAGGNHVLRVDFYLEKSTYQDFGGDSGLCDPGVGNGIEFTGMPLEVQAANSRHNLDGIDPQMGIFGRPSRQGGKRSDFSESVPRSGPIQSHESARPW